MVLIEHQLWHGDFEAKPKISLLTHTKSVHEDHLSPAETCIICGEHFKMKQQLYNHRRNHKSWRCTICGKTVAGTTSLKAHNLRCIKDVQPKFQCQICNYTSVAKSDFKRHLNTHTVSPTKLHSCNVCDFETEAKTLLRKHVRKHTSRPKYECQKCNKMFVNKDKFEQHVADHEAQKHKQQNNISEYKCNICKYTTKRKFDLKRHIWRHDTPKIPKDSGPEIVSFV